MTIDICVVSYNNIDQLPRLIEKLHDDYVGGWKLYIADNGSTDGTAEWLNKNFDVDAGTVIFNDNVGYAAACNQLAAMGTGEIIGLLNADVWMSSYDVRRIEDTFNADASISILGPKQRNEAGNIVHAGIEGTNTSCRPRAWQMPDPHDQYFREQEDMVSVAGSAYFIRRSVWDYLTECPIYKEQHPQAEGAFLPTPLYYEETWCSYHAAAHGFRVVYDGSISIGHSWAGSSGGVNAHLHELFLESQVIFRAMCERHSIPHD